MYQSLEKQKQFAVEFTGSILHAGLSSNQLDPLVLNLNSCQPPITLDHNCSSHAKVERQVT